jgi:hypothetical protein
MLHAIIIGIVQKLFVYDSNSKLFIFAMKQHKGLNCVLFFR